MIVTAVLFFIWLLLHDGICVNICKPSLELTVIISYGQNDYKPIFS